MKITTNELRTAALDLLEHLDRMGHAVVEVDDDFYWDVPESARYDRYQQPTQLTLGQLSDDLSEIRRLIDGSKEPLGYGLVWLAAILRRIGETTAA